MNYWERLHRNCYHLNANMQSWQLWVLKIAILIVYINFNKLSVLIHVNKMWHSLHLLTCSLITTDKHNIVYFDQIQDTLSCCLTHFSTKCLLIKPANSRFPPVCSLKKTTVTSCCRTFMTLYIYEVFHGQVRKSRNFKRHTNITQALSFKYALLMKWLINFQICWPQLSRLHDTTIIFHFFHLPVAQDCVCLYMKLFLNITTL